MMQLEAVGHGHALLCDTKRLVFAVGRRICAITSDQKVPTVVMDRFSKTKGTLLEQYSLFARALRLGVSHFAASVTYKLAIHNGAIYRASVSETSATKVFETPRGRRPLNICMTPSGSAYFGEYFDNPSRDAVRIYGTKDGRSWTPVYEFARGQIRHIHGLRWDSYRKRIWILTGDSDRESGLWYTDNDFDDVRFFVGGDQRYRAVSMIVESDGLIVPMDSPTEKNFLHRIDLRSLETKKLAELPNSTFDIVSCGDLLLLSTVPEPSLCNDTTNVHLFASRDSKCWKCVGSYAGDFLSRHISNKLFQYPRLKLCEGFFDDSIFANALGLKGIPDGIVKLSVADLRRLLE